MVSESLRYEASSCTSWFGCEEGRYGQRFVVINQRQRIPVSMVMDSVTRAANGAAVKPSRRHVHEIGFFANMLRDGAELVEQGVKVESLPKERYSTDDDDIKSRLLFIPNLPARCYAQLEKILVDLDDEMAVDYIGMVARAEEGCLLLFRTADGAQKIYDRCNTYRGIKLMIPKDVGLEGKDIEVALDAFWSQGNLHADITRWEEKKRRREHNLSRTPSPN